MTTLYVIVHLIIISLSLFFSFVFVLWLNRIWLIKRDPAYHWLALGVGWFPFFSTLITYVVNVFFSNKNNLGPSMDQVLSVELLAWTLRTLTLLKHVAILMAIAGFYGFKVDIQSLIKPLRGMHVDD